MKEKPIKELTPIYLGVARLVKVIDLVSNRSFASVQSSVFEAYGFSNVDALLALSALRFLGLIDDGGLPTELMTKLRLSGDIRKKEFEKILRIAYKKLFDVSDTPQDLPIDQLESEFILQYKISKRVLKSAVPAFLKLCEIAGLREESPLRKTSNGDKVKKAQSRPPKPAPPFNETPARTPSGLTIIAVVDGKAAIGIPAGNDQKALLDKEVRKHLDAFIEAARLYAATIKDKSPESEESEDS